ncbi:MAG: hypothetical protein M1828_002960 [Chrysothrix sp. TS-e1954]|nr:MAG: hypothetical protein M1828_002960 [Chrysothrix sp. TS-e1954]
MSVAGSAKALARAAESSSKSWKVGSQSAKDLGKRVVHVRVYPGVRNMSESRGVLRMLRSYGDVVYYENKRHPESAAKLISATPFHFRYKPPQPVGPITSPITAPLLQMSYAEDRRRDEHSATSEEVSATTAPAEEEHDFYMTAELSQEDYLARFQEKQYYWGYDVQNRTFASDALRNRVPTKAMSEIPAKDMPPVPRRLVQRKLASISRRQSLRDMRQSAIDDALAGRTSSPSTGPGDNESPESTLTSPEDSSHEQRADLG